ncbi:melatonin receptor type 1B-A-like [Asterias amurensis]|uniref:melatonin receptor type 1B-A-like n=1 Tax=Asterias amurensis TaxID=7602 RepID=UPI003AB341E1
MDINDTMSNSTTVSWLPNTTMTTTSIPAVHSYTVRVVVGVLFLLIAVINITGNSMVIFAVIFSKKLRTSTNVFVVSLSSADLLAGLALPMSAVALLSPGNSWPGSTEAPCYIAGLLLFTSSTASLFNLASIALNRLILIKSPMKMYLILYTKCNLVINVVVIWIVAIAIMTVPPLLEIGSFGFDKQQHTCTDLDNHPKAKTFKQIQTFGSYPISFIIIITSYIMIFVHVRRHFKKEMRKNDNITVTSISSSSGGVTSFQTSDNAAIMRASRRDRISRQQLEITKNLFMTVCAFFICITPYSVALFLPNNDRFLLYGGVVFLCNSCVNPIIYAAKHPQFKKVLRLMLRCKYSEIEEPSDTIKYLTAKCCCKS